MAGTAASITVTLSTTGVGTPTGTISLFDNGTFLQSKALTSPTTFAVTFSTSGTHPLTATYTGDVNFAASTSPTYNLSVGYGTATSVVSSNGASILYDASLSIQVRVSPTTTTGTPTGNVTLLEGTTALAGPTALSAGTATFTLPARFSPAGSHTLTISYQGVTGSWAASSITAGIFVNYRPTNVSVSSSPSPVYGDPVTFTATVKDTTSNTAVPGGTVSFKEGAVTINSGTATDANGQASSSGVFTATTHTVTATYSPATGYLTNSNSVIFTVAKRPTALAISFPTQISYGQAGLGSATVVGGAGETGGITFVDGATAIATSSIFNDVGTMPLSLLRAGAHSLTASYPGDANHVSSTSSAAVVNVSPSQSTTTLMAPGDPWVPNAPMMLTAQVTSTSGLAPGTGTVSFFDGSTAVGTGVLTTVAVGQNTVGQATILFSNVLPGQHSFTATYAGDANLSASTSGTLTRTVSGLKRPERCDSRCSAAVHFVVAGAPETTSGAPARLTRDSGTAGFVMPLMVTNGSRLTIPVVATDALYCTYLSSGPPVTIVTGDCSSVTLQGGPVRADGGNDSTITVTAVGADGKAVTAYLSVIVPGSLTISLAPTSNIVLLGNTLAFSQVVTLPYYDTSNDISVVWAVNGIPGGNTTVGTISNVGIYTAPARMPTNPVVTISARSRRDPSKVASRALTITDDMTLLVYGAGNAVQPSATVNVSAVMTTAGNPDPALTWYVNNIPGGNSSVGTIQSTGVSTAAYTAPGTVALGPGGGPAITIKAVSVADPAIAGTAGFYVGGPSVALNADATSVLLGNTQQVNASVAGTLATGLTWKVNGIVGGNATLGTVSTTGQYTAPGKLPNPAVVTVTATSAADSTRVGTIRMNVNSDVVVRLTTLPGTTLAAATKVSARSLVQSNGKPDTTVLWLVNGIPNGNASSGTVTPGSDSRMATYTAPAATAQTASVPSAVSLTAVSNADPSKSASTTLNVTGQNPGGISLSASYGPPGSVLTITTEAKLTAPVQVLFSDGASYNLAVDADLTDQNHITLAVPFFLDVSTFQTHAATVNVSVISSANSSPMQSGPLPFTIGDLPVTNQPPGTVTLQVLGFEKTLIALSIVQYGGMQKVANEALLANGIGKLSQMSLLLDKEIANIRAIMNGSISQVPVASVNGAPFVLNSASLALMDRVFTAYFFAGTYPSATTASMRTDRLRTNDLVDDFASDFQSFIGTTLPTDIVNMFRPVRRAAKLVTTVAGIAIVAGTASPLVVAAGVTGALVWLATSLPPTANVIALEGAGALMTRQNISLSDMRQSVTQVQEVLGDAANMGTDLLTYNSNWEYLDDKIEGAVNDAKDVALNKLQEVIQSVATDVSSWAADKFTNDPNFPLDLTNQMPPAGDGSANPNVTVTTQGGNNFGDMTINMTGGKPGAVATVNPGCGAAVQNVTFNGAGMASVVVTTPTTTATSVTCNPQVSYLGKTFFSLQLQVPTTHKATLSVYIDGDGGGSVTGTGINCGSVCSAEFDVNSSSAAVVTLTASPDIASRFKGWDAPCGGATAGSTAPYYYGPSQSCTIYVTDDVSVTAKFRPRTFSGYFTGTLEDRGASGCPKPAGSLSGPATMSLSLAKNGAVAFSGSANMIDNAHLCEDYGGEQSFSGYFSQSMMFFDFLGGQGEGTFNSSGTIFGTWSFSRSGGPDVGQGTFYMYETYIP